MNIVLLKNKLDNVSVTLQQKQILKYAHHHGIHIDNTEIENSSPNLELEDRKEFKGFLRSLNNKDQVIIFNLFTFSEQIEELIKVFECLLTRSIAVHIADSNTMIDENSKILVLLELLSKQRELNQNFVKEKLQGRPKGRMSKSKFDIFRPKIIEFLEDGKSISEISQILEMRRTSLKDYVNSRGLKDLVKAKILLLQSSKKQKFSVKLKNTKECSLINEPINQNEGIKNEL